MYKSVSDKDSADWEVLDLDTNEFIRGVQWADDESGEYERLVFEKDGSVSTRRYQTTLPVFDDKGEIVSSKPYNEAVAKTVTCKGNIKFVRKEK